MSSRPLLHLDTLTKRYGRTLAVDGISASIQRGELVSFVGPSGCGKTTLLRLIGGFLRPDAGGIILDGETITGLPPNRRPTAMVFQNYALFPHLTVSQNIGYALAIRKRPRAEIARRVEELLTLVKLPGLGGRLPVQLSGGEQQRVALARALSLQPKVLLLDEPLSNLDANLRVQMRTEIKRLQLDLDQTVVFVTHDQEEAMSISDRIMVMHQGRILQVGTPAEIYERPATEFIARFVGAVNFITGVLGSGVPQRLTVATPLGSLCIRSRLDGLAPGDRVCMVVRPEAVRLHPHGENAGPTSLAGAVETIMYTGASIRCAVNVNGTRLMVDLADPRHARAFRPGDRVTVILPDDPHILPAAPAS
jgi:ABC-type Fe3+/spermidine/putrescine transport system ATPase subunit